MLPHSAGSSVCCPSMQRSETPQPPALAWRTGAANGSLMGFNTGTTETLTC